MGRPASLTEIATDTKMHPSKLHRYLVSLIRAGFAQRDGRGLYVASFASQMAQPRSSQARAIEVAEHGLAELARRIGETVFISTWAPTGPAILRVDLPERLVSVRVRANSDLTVSDTAVGRAFAAFMESEHVTPIVEAEFARLKLSQTEVSKRRKTFARRLEEVRARGVSRSVSELYQGMVAFSVPVFDDHAHPVLAITAFGIEAMIESGWNSVAARVLAEYAAEVTRKIGGLAPGARSIEV